MSIQIISKHPNNQSFRLKCFECGHEEDSQSHGNWTQFKEHIDDNAFPIRTCLNCGHQYPRKSVTFAKLINSSIVHLCVKWDGEFVQARCGNFSGSLFDSNKIEVSEVESHNRPCKQCAVAMGAYRNDVIWETEQGMAKERAFYSML